MDNPFNSHILLFILLELMIKTPLEMFIKLILPLESKSNCLEL